MPDSGDLLIRRTPAGATPYETEFYDWCLEQAQALRARAGSDDSIDWENVAEEIEGLAGSDRRACESLIQRIEEHLLKIEFMDRLEEVHHHEMEILNFRRQLERVLSPSLRASMPNWVDLVYFDAVKVVTALYRTSSRKINLPSACPYSWEDVLGHETGTWIPDPTRDSD